LTFQGVEEPIAELEAKLYENVFVPGFQINISVIEIKERLTAIKNTLQELHNSLFVDQVQSLINKIDIFGLYFASLDVRQDSSIHEKLFAAAAEKGAGVLPANYTQLSEAERIKALLAINSRIDNAIFDDEVVRDTAELPLAIK